MNSDRDFEACDVMKTRGAAQSWLLLYSDLVVRGEVEGFPSGSQCSWMSRQLHIFSKSRICVTQLDASLKPSTRDEHVISSIWHGQDFLSVFIPSSHCFSLSLFFHPLMSSLFFCFLSHHFPSLLLLSLETDFLKHPCAGRAQRLICLNDYLNISCGFLCRESCCWFRLKTLDLCFNWTRVNTSCSDSNRGSVILCRGPLTTSTLLAAQWHLCERSSSASAQRF